MRGILPAVLTKLYGWPHVIESSPWIEHRWNERRFENCCILYEPMPQDAIATSNATGLEELYGDSIGGFLVGDSLKIATRCDLKIWGLYRIVELRNHPAVLHAQLQDSNISYFMDAANTWYYGVKAGDLWVYDTAGDELDCLGEISCGLQTLIQQWDAASPEV